MALIVVLPMPLDNVLPALAMMFIGLGWCFGMAWRSSWASRRLAWRCYSPQDWFRWFGVAIGPCAGCCLDDRRRLSGFLVADTYDRSGSISDCRTRRSSAAGRPEATGNDDLL